MFDLMSPDYTELFSDTRREQLLADASRDRHGRPVVYYRYMPRAILDRMIEQGYVTALDHFADPDSPLQELTVARGVSHMFADDQDYNRREYRTVANLLPRLERYSHEFARQLGLLASRNQLTPRFVHPLVMRYMDRRALKQVHSGSKDQPISPYLSLSVGSIICGRLSPGEVYVELVIPDAMIEPNAEGVVGEKEVLATQLQAGWITRVYETNGQLRREILDNPATPIGKYKDHPKTRMTPQIDVWRWGEATEDYLPVGL